MKRDGRTHHKRRSIWERVRVTCLVRDGPAREIKRLRPSIREAHVFIVQIVVIVLARIGMNLCDRESRTTPDVPTVPQPAFGGLSVRFSSIKLVGFAEWTFL